MTKERKEKMIDTEAYFYTDTTCLSLFLIPYPGVTHSHPLAGHLNSPIEQFFLLFLTSYSLVCFIDYCLCP